MTQIITAILVDDETRSLENLSNMLKKYCPDVEILATCQSIDQAYADIIDKKPQLIFLDVDMPPYTGFDLLDRFDDLPFEVIFVTAFDHYAIDAIKFSALYYILKPIRVDELKKAIEKAHKKLGISTVNYFNKIKDENNQIKRLVIKNQKGMDMIELDHIIYLEADNVYTVFQLIGAKQIVSSKSLKDYELMLTDKGFFRSHKSFIVNLSHVKNLDTHDGNQINLSENTKVYLSERKKDAFLKIVSSPPK
jgi:two-component system, LytTR family, response regulator